MGSPTVSTDRKGKWSLWYTNIERSKKHGTTRRNERKTRKAQYLEANAEVFHVEDSDHLCQMPLVDQAR